MKFVDLKKSLQKEVLPCYLIMGEDSFLCDLSEKLIEKQIFGQEIRNNLNKQTFSTENTDTKKFIDALNTMPFFAEKKLVVYKQYDEKIPNDLVSQLKEYLKSANKNTVLVIQALNKTEAFKSILPNVESVNCSRLDVENLQKWIISKLNKSGTKIQADAMSLLIDYTNGYLSKISNELDKLIAYSNQLITKENVEKLVSKDLEYSVYELTEAIVCKDSTKAINIKNSLMSSRKTYSATLNVCFSYFRRLFMSLVSNSTTADIASMLGVKEFAVIKSKQQAKKIGASKLKQIVELCAELDFKTKTSEISLENATDYLLVYLLNI